MQRAMDMGILKMTVADTRFGSATSRMGSIVPAIFSNEGSNRSYGSIESDTSYDLRQSCNYGHA
jgi:hypothetical protein